MSPLPHLAMALPTWNARDRKWRSTTTSALAGTSFEANKSSTGAETPTAALAPPTVAHRWTTVALETSIDADDRRQMTHVACMCSRPPPKLLTLIDWPRPPLDFFHVPAFGWSSGGWRNGKERKRRKTMKMMIYQA